MALFFLQLVLLTGNAGTVPQFHVQTANITKSSSTMGSRIIGGAPTTIQQYPFTVQLLYESQFHCGGSLVTTIHVLTAASCLFDKHGNSRNRSSLSIRAGSTFLNSGGTLHAVSSVKVHESYDAKTVTWEDDIALLNLSTLVNETSGAARVGVFPIQNFVVPDRAHVTAVGWGLTSVNPSLNPTNWSTVLMMVTMKIINQTICQARYEMLQVTNGINFPIPITSNMICAGILDVGGKGPCRGDPGGPLIYGGLVVGVISGSAGCALRDYPHVFTRVASYTNWIVNTVLEMQDAFGAGTLSSKIGAITLLGPLVFLMLSA